MQEYNKFNNQKRHQGEYESDETQRLLNKYQKEHQLQQGQNRQEINIKDKKEKILKSKMNDPFEQVLIDEKYNPIGKKVKRNNDPEYNQKIQLQQHQQEIQQKEISKFLQINQQQQQDFKNVENSKVFLDIMIQNQIQKVIIELFDKVVPKTAQNFRALCTGEYGFSFQNNVFHRVIPNFMAQGGDITHNNGQGGKSIYGQKFQDENFKIKHDKPYLLSMANSGPNSNGSQFFITFKECAWLDGKHVVFGKVIQGFNTIKQMEQFGDQSGQPLTKIVIKNCGVYENLQQVENYDFETQIDQNIQQDIQELQKQPKFIPRQIKQNKKIDQLLSNFEQKLHQQQEYGIDQEQQKEQEQKQQQEQAYSQQQQEKAYLQQQQEKAYLQQQLQKQLQQDKMKLQQQEIKKDVNQQINKKKAVFDYSDSEDDNEQQQFQPTSKQIQQDQQDSEESDDLSGSILDYIDEQYNSDEI